MIKQIIGFFSNNSEEKVESKLVRPTALLSSDKNEALSGVTIKQVKEMLLSEDIAEVVKLFDLMTSRDLHLAGALSTRQDQLQSLEYKITGDDTVVKFAKSYLESIEFALFLKSLTSSIDYGFSVLDLSWSITPLGRENYFVPTSHKLISARYFNYDSLKKDDLTSLYLTVDKEKRYLSSYDTRKILTHFHKTDTEHITRYSVLYKCAWFVALKHQVIASNMQWFDALGVPPLIINQDTTDEKDLESVLYQALSLRSNSVGIFPKGVEISMLTEKMSKNDFLTFIEYIDKQVSYFVTGQTMATTSGSTGSYAQAKVHENRLIEKKKFDAKLLDKSITDLLNIIIEQNFSEPKKVLFKFVVKESKDLKELSETVKNLEDGGFEVPATYVEEEFGIAGVKRKAVETIANNRQFFTEYNASKSTINTDTIEKEVGKIDLNTVEEALTTRLIGAIEKTKSFEEAYALLADDESIDIEELENLLAQYITNGQMQGVDDGND